MQNKPSKNQHRNVYYRLRRSDPHERLSARLRRFSFGAAVFFVMAAAGIVTYSLYKIQIEQGATFRQYAAEQQLLDSTIQATRGEIYDASGITLASTSVVWTIWADPSYSTALFTSQTAEETGEVLKTVDETTLAEVSRQITLRLLSGDGESLDRVDTSSAEYQTQYQTVHDALAKNTSSYQVLATKVNNAVKLSIEKYVSTYNKEHTKAKTLEDGTTVRKGRISVSSSKSFQRDYPYGAFAASVLGFCNGDGEGFYGLEKSYDSTLAGVNGRTITRRNAYGNAIADANATTYAAKDGSNLVLSLDVNVQEVVERYLNEAVYANNVENRGAAIVMNVKTGAILAMASKPDFDPNDPLDFSANLTYLSEQVQAEPEIYTIYLKDPDDPKKFLLDENGKKVPDPDPDYTGTYRDIQWKNKAITELYYPGSVFKVITAAMGVDSGKATYYTTLNCSGAYGVAKETYHCAGKKSHGVQNLAEALRNSCNIYFIQLGQRLGSSVFYDYFDAFGFTERTGVDLPNETGMMKYYTKNQLGEVQLASSAFGQAMAVTPLQVCTAISAAVNGGYLVTPHVVDKITDQNGNVVEEVGANVRRQVISESASETIRQIMEYEVGDGSTSGGGSNAYVAGYRIGGKSGTSEQLNMERRADGDYKKVASFAAVLPANDPEILVYVMLDDPNNARTDYSSILAAPVVGNIISEIAPYLGIATDGIDRSQTTVKVPNLVSKEWSNAQVALNNKGLKHQLVESESSQTAAVVTYQYPHAGAEVASGTTIYLYTDTYSGSHTEVPDVSGKSADFARQMLTAAGLNCQVAGEGTGTVQSQSEAAGASVQKGTVVTITCG
ncbi:penicillin-binding transpeptidase domain-containing protein [Faecalibacterium sp. I3-3-89]|uniref:penicillin-binding transpeptidase domain-containing protein n=1 Tax=Faecalibacterium sp. I3-3-89 TaxID=2929493 RepID=UPI00095E150B|nr:penicillin-binding transpeptidase domain-containing protein [Faecalibacterium sp. I3-3-89]OLA33031.1 MAG: peptidase [Faecalibacterium prausnitzii]UQK43585.1 PASTA domain-containing protein [Faecalibacterium sp. I3-3-89]